MGVTIGLLPQGVRGSSELELLFVTLPSRVVIPDGFLHSICGQQSAMAVRIREAPKRL
jgi:hypothetical protein